MLTKSIIRMQSYSQIIKRHIIIKNEHVKACSNCLFFIKPTSPDIQASLYHRCKKFGEKDIITGEIDHLFALSCRKDKSLCGMEAKHFIYNWKK